MSAAEPASLEGQVAIWGWAHTGDCHPDLVDMFLVFSSVPTGQERIFPVNQERVLRGDVPAVFPGYPDRCGFSATVPFADLVRGTYRIGVVQRTPTATYFDATPIVVRRD